MAVTQARFWTPWGEGVVEVLHGTVVHVGLPALPPGDPALVVPAPRTPRAGDTEPASQGGQDAGPGVAAPAGDDVVAARWARQLEAYFLGERAGWTADEVDVAALGLGLFREAVYKALLSVPAGRTITYGELAQAAGRPGAARAVGTAMAQNPIPLVVPCHRCVCADGTLGRYGDDDRWKPLLLRFEGAR